MIHNFNPPPKADISPTHCDDCLRPPTKRTRILPPTSGPCAQLTQAELELANELAVLKAEVNEAKLTAEISDQIQAAMQEETERLKAALEKEAAERDERERRMAEELEVLRTELEKARATQKASKDRARMMESQYEGSESQYEGSEEEVTNKVIEVMEENQSLKKVLKTMYEECQKTKKTLHEVANREKEATRLLEFRTQQTHQLGQRIQRLVESIEEVKKEHQQTKNQRDEAVDKYALLSYEVWARITEEHERKREEGKKRYAREREKRKRLGQQEPEMVFKTMKEHLAEKKEKEKVEDEAPKQPSKRPPKRPPE
ncbi:hypothetical protein BDZ91DRAFT_720054 [Kalaharituber pfeilii]|nr:hypothetical protein BDZ91DRAFT_720054 [Kalaharituber pfeilii]